MKYYHVRIYTQQDPDNKWEWVRDLSREKLEELIIAPYRVGRHITINGRTIRVEDLRRITLEQTDGPWETTHDASTDVTNAFITSSPGSETGTGAAALRLAQASLDSAATITNGAARRDSGTSSDYRRIAHRDSKAVAESIHEREDQAFINAVTDYDDS